MSNKTYDRWKWVALVLIPALIAAWTGLSKIWGWPYAAEIAGTLAIIDTFLGAILGISSAKYNAHNAQIEGDADD
jgi:hypothetical protein